MIGDWFEKVKFKQPFRYIDAVVKIGVGGVAVFVVAFWVFWGSPTKVDSVQSGFRGTGMAQLEFESEVARLRALNQMPFSEEPYVPEVGEPLARDIYENVQILGNLTEDNFNRLMLAMTEWVSPEQGCVYCHGEGGLETYGADDLYTKLVSRRMLQMTMTINADWSQHVAPAGVNCYTCHRGENVPEYLWFEQVPAGNVGPSAMYQNRPTEAAVSSSLPSNAIQTYLVEGAPIRVQAVAPRQDNATFASTQQTEATFSLMMHMSDSLGVNCTFCHNSRAWGEWEQSPPQRVTAWHGIRMVQKLNAEYLVPLGPVYPAERLGALGDAPKVMCASCHQGVNKPLLGAPAVENWPELISIDPVYLLDAAAID